MKEPKKYFKFYKHVLNANHCKLMQEMQERII